MTSPPQRFQRSRLLAVCIASSAYVLYALLTALIDPPGPFPSAYRTPKYWGRWCRW
ncbi:hypothetical protein ACFQDE_13315 [Deinococcus caeni]|uniref:hypothetical protein n=1 Tax=Deinococcus caeni TaxID=569127 RepID=UPI003623F247